MFKKVIQSLSKSLSKQGPAPAPASAPAAKGSAPAGARTIESPLKKIVEAPAPAKVADAPKSPEELIGIEPKMNKDQIRDRLKLLYRRYNRAASSLDSHTRAEADTMLDAIVQVREKHFGLV